MAKIVAGDRWARLKCIRVEPAKRVVEFPGGSEEIQFIKAVLGCECGKQISIDRDSFQGKRSMRDCGCGLGSQDSGGVARAVFMPMALWLEIREYADGQWRGNWSAAACELMRAGLKVKAELEG